MQIQNWQHATANKKAENSERNFTTEKDFK